MFDKQDQFDKIAANLLQGEFIIAVYDAIGAGTGFIGLTNKRVVIQDNSFVGKRVALTSIPYAKINNVSFVSDRSMMGKFFSTSSISVSTGGR
ncbi:MAG: PH domain-containing protein, partial [Propionibacteriaceae bacterium]|nr:PH domain-containing protein [Propionibacteriaceae bacterium]